MAFEDKTPDKEARRDAAIRNVMARRPLAVAEPCPDEDTLAAYAEHSLDANETARLEAHFAVCARCQEVLAALALIDPVEVEEKALAAVAAAPAQAMAAAAPPDGCAVLQPRNEPPKKRSGFSWVLAPALVAAALVLLFLPQIEHVIHPPTATRQVAETSPQPQVAQPTPPASAANSLSTTTGPVAAPDETKRDRAAEEKKAAAKPSLPRDASGAAPARETRALAAAAPAAQPPPPPSATSPGQVTASAGAELQQMNGGVAGSGAGAGGGLGGRVSSDRAAAKASGFMSPPPIAQTSESAAALAAAPQVAGGNPLAPAASSPMHLVFPENGNVVWRIGAGGKIERSTDSEQTWQPQNSGVTTNLFAGSAPNNDICWVVGANGTILRTTDGGAQWDRITSPTFPANPQPDWSFVTAANANSATVTMIDGRGFATTDGGATWKAVRR